MAKDDQENAKLCDGCTLCCEHVALEIDVPEDLKDYEEIVWYVLHKDVSVFIDDEGCWYIQFEGKCTQLDNGKCNLYNKRPYLCRDYNQDDCVKYGEGEPHVWKFDNREQFLEYVKKKKPQIWRKLK
ncbi:MAG: YkgJ family cysteine cluster protein [Nanoarchaeota archaeon]|nr:YkgJ family cysteine cluster protein [Nanoarchaeota archaeon]